MPEYSLKDSIITSLNAQEPWPDNVMLFQPYEVEQILLPDNASCLAVQAFLKMCNLPFEVEMRWNAEFMSPSGRVPFIKCGAFVVSELEPIVQFAANKGVSLCSRLSSEEKAEMRAYMSLITNVLVNAELYISWIHEETFNSVTKTRNSSVYPWPLGWIQTRSKRNAVTKRLKALHWHDKTLDQVLADVEQCCKSLSQRLGDRDYFFGSGTELDALVYAHTRAALSCALLPRVLKPPLLRHMLRVANRIGDKLTPEEDRLVSRAFTAPPARPRRPRARPPGSGDVFGFKPFASKHIVMATKDAVSDENPSDDQETLSYMQDIFQDILDKVHEITFENIDAKDFEVIHKEDDNVCLDTIEDFHDFSTNITAAMKPSDSILFYNAIQCHYDGEEDVLDNETGEVAIDSDGIVDRHLFRDGEGSPTLM
ncbi:metaxin-2 isoform X1 [Plutella xylostella]|uniref:metaxin-2 isoform X1 n=1 Tax=Plutella xylostella TaxID=51655 RepID=UPI0020327FFB|nr:metaxin-2 isoform X1 [Plutella xylostella]